MRSHEYQSRPGAVRRRVAWTGALLIAGLAVDPAWAQGRRDADPSRPEDPIPLEELVVTASGFEQSRINAPASVTVLTRSTISTQRNTSLAELLANVEGIDVGDRVGKTGGLNIQLRGMPSDYTLILIDGRRQNPPGNVTPNGFHDTSSGFLPPLSMIERVEVIRGPMSTLYGSDAMGGVINIITRRVGDRWRGSVGVDATLQEESGFGNMYSGNLAINGPVVPGRVGLSLRGSVFHRQRSELKPTGEVGEGVEISRRGPSPVEGDIYTLGARLTFTPTRGHDIWLEVDRARQAYDNSEGQLGTLDRPDADPPQIAGYGPKLRFHRDQAALVHHWRFGSGTLQSSLSWNTTETLGRTIPEGTPGGPPGSGAPNKPAGAPRTLEATNVIFDTKLVRSLGRHMVTVGGQYWDAEMVDGVALEPFTFTQWALFLEDEWSLTNALALTLGVRRDDHSTFGGHVSPRAYLVWHATPNVALKGGISRGYKAPRVEQLVDGIIGFRGQGTIAVIGTPSLKPETSTSTEVGVHYTTAGGLGASLTLFNNQFDDKIAEGTPVPNCTYALAPNRPGCVDYGYFPEQESFAQSVNVDEAVTRGVEATATVPFGGIWSLSGNYTYTWSEQRSGENRGMPLTNTPRHMINASLRVRPSDRLSGWLRGEYRSKRARRTTNDPDPAYEALGDYKAYSLFHLGGSYDLGRGVTLNATIYNLLNTDFLRFAAYPVEPTPRNPSGIAYTSVYANHQEGRRLWVSLSYEF
jgi:outer membrane receptor for ferrienterochelin and colicins